MKKLLAFLVLFLGCCLLSHSKERKLTNNLFFDGKITKKLPDGYGILIARRNDEAVCAFEGIYGQNSATSVKIKLNDKNVASARKISFEYTKDNTQTFSVTLYDSHFYIDGNVYITDQNVKLIFKYDQNTGWSNTTPVTFYASTRDDKKDWFDKWAELVDFKSYNRAHDSCYITIDSNCKITSQHKTTPRTFLDGISLSKSYPQSTVYEILQFPNGDFIGLEGLSSTAIYHDLRLTLQKNGTVVNIFPQKQEMRLTYNNGDVFEGKFSTINYMIILKYLKNNLTEDDFPKTDGKLICKNGDVQIWKNGKSMIKKIEKIEQQQGIRTIPNKLYESDYKIEKLKHRLADGTIEEHKIYILSEFLKGDYVRYLDLPDVRSELQFRVFTQDPEYKSVYLPKLEIERKNLLQDEYEIVAPIYNSNFIRGLKFDAKTNRFQTYIFDTNYETKEGKGTFRIQPGNLHLAYPRSMTSITLTNDYASNSQSSSADIYTCTVSDVDALKVEKNYKDCALVWVIKIEKIVDEQIYAKPTKMYIKNIDTDEIYCDLTNTLKAPNTKFKKITREGGEKKFHKQGRKFECVCNYGINSKGNVCGLCGGKGYHIEYWW